MWEPSSPSVQMMATTCPVSVTAVRVTVGASIGRAWNLTGHAALPGSKELTAMRQVSEDQIYVDRR